MERPEYSSATGFSGAEDAGDEPRAPKPASALRRMVAWGLLPAAVGVHLLAAQAPSWVERLYARGLYPLVAAALSWLTGLLPFSVAELHLAAAVVLAVMGMVAFVRGLARSAGRRWRVAGRALRRLWAGAGIAYALFVGLWGLNYRRQPMAESLGLVVRPAPPSELAAVAAELADEANRARVGLPEDGAGVFRLTDGLRGTLRRVPLGFAAAARTHPLLAGASSPPKAALLSPLLSRMGITGIFCPFTGEAHVNADVPAPDLPFTASHELAHGHGFAREEEASYAGYLACLSHPDPGFRYSGVLMASAYAQSALARADRQAARRVEAARSAAVRRDLDALREWAARHQGPVEEASRRVNDAYLRAHGEADGVRSYGRMVDLLLAERRAR